MKFKQTKPVIIILCSLLLAPLMLAKNTGVGIHKKSGIFELKGGYFYPTESAFKDIYGGGGQFGAELILPIWNKLDIWLAGNFFQKKGELTFTKEETKLQIIPAGAGLRYRLTSGVADLYFGAGVNYYFFKETNPIGTASKGGVGYIGKLGVCFHVLKGVVFDLFFDYSYCRIKPADFTINIGGIAAGAGLGFAFPF